MSSGKILKNGKKKEKYDRMKGMWEEKEEGVNEEKKEGKKKWGVENQPSPGLNHWVSACETAFTTKPWSFIISILIENFKLFFPPRGVTLSELYLSKNT